SNLLQYYVFPPNVLADPVSCSKHCGVSLHNDNVDIINGLVLNRVPGELLTLEGRTLLNHELLECELDDAFAMTDYLSTLRHSGEPSHILKLKSGSVRHANTPGSTKMGPSSKTSCLTRSKFLPVLLKDGTIHWIPRITFSFITWQGVDVKRVQFPVRLCFAVTVHRSQGQTLNRVVFYLSRRDVFMHGCLYVGLARVRNSADIRILTTEDRIY
ncbi:unnamed protein product, partial [Laminaria digitata]